MSSTDKEGETPNLPLISKIYAFINWAGNMLINGLGFITAPIIFPLAYLLRNIPIVRNKILWIYFDDEDEFGFDVDWWMRGKKPSFWMAYKWCALRNPAWNLQAALKPNIRAPKTLISESGTHHRGGDITIDPFVMCVLKWLTENHEYSDNKGEYLSIRHSVLGKKFLWFKFGDHYWRYSFADKVWKNMWIEFQIGTSDTRHTFRLKFKWIKPERIVQFP